MRPRALVLLAALAAAPALLLSSDSVRADRTANVFEIATGFSARQACTCAFVIEQTDEYCQAFGQVPGEALPVDVAIDHDAKTVTSTLSGVSRTARAATGVGCTLDPLP